VTDRDGSQHVVDECPVDLRTGRVYEHGWQSWSPTAVYPVTATSARPDLGWQQTMRFRPSVPAPQRGFQAEGLLVVRPEPGRQRVYAAEDPLRDVPSIRAELEGDRLVVRADGPVTVEDVDGTLGDAVCGWADATTARLDVPAPRPAPSVWCSWYRYFLEVTAGDVEENLAAFDQHDLPVDVVQIDDGWQTAVGDWEPADRFGSLPDLVARIREAGRRPGIWLAPFVALPSSELARRHPDWMVGGAGWNWDQQMLGLDLQHQEVHEHLAEVFGRLRVMGFDYFKLDFLYAGALPRPGGHDDRRASTTSYRAGLQTIRDAVGPDAYLLGCGAPILPSLGLVDGMRISPDTYNPTDPDDGHNPLRGRACIENRAWQHGRFWTNDADCLIVRPGFGRREEWAALIARYGGLRSCSDRIAELDEWGLTTTRRQLSAPPSTRPFTILPDAFEE
jgi:alpha-galactosidase